ncbi:MAG: sigma-70 family RNA polymerase sigma factor [Verrucomicrobiota bacterium]
MGGRRATFGVKPMETDRRQVLTEWLVLTAQAGGEAAFRDLYALWRDDLRRLALVRVERAEAADEVLVEAWVDIARGLRRLDDPACFPRWAFRIVERRCADWIRRRGRERRRQSEAAAEADLLAPAGEGSEPSCDVLRLRAAIRRLPPDARELLHLFYDLGRGVAEIAEIFGVPAGTVKSRLFSVRETLKRHIERNHHE